MNAAPFCASDIFIALLDMRNAYVKRIAFYAHEIVRT